MTDWARAALEFLGSLVGVAVAIWGARHVEDRRRTRERADQAESLRGALAAEVAVIRGRMFAEADWLFSSRLTANRHGGARPSLDNIPRTVFDAVAGDLGLLEDPRLSEWLVNYYDLARRILAEGAAFVAGQEFPRIEPICLHLDALTRSWENAVALEERLRRETQLDRLAEQGERIAVIRAWLDGFPWEGKERIDRDGTT